MLTVGEVQQALPVTLKGMATPEFVDKINNIASDPEAARMVRENFVSYTSVLRDGKYKTDDYLSAVTYVTYKHLGLTNLDAYALTHPDRYQDLVARGAASKDIAAYVSAYNKGKLVNAILEQTLVPVWVYNQHNYQKAINTQVELMETAVSEKVRSDAANSILTHLAKPKEALIKLDVTTNQDNGMKELTDMLERVAQRQLQIIDQGDATAKDLAAMPLIEKSATQIIEAEAKEVNKRVFD